MTTLHLLPEDLRPLYVVHEWRNATGVLATACLKEWQDILQVLRNFRLLRSEILTAGGGLSPIWRQVNGAFDALGWTQKKFVIKSVVDDSEHFVPTHAVDCFKGRVAIEFEWNNKEVFYDRDLSNFRVLFEARAIDVAVIITRSSDLDGIFDNLGKHQAYGIATTHHLRLLPRMNSGCSGGCPVLSVAIGSGLYVDDGPEAVKRTEALKAEALKAEARRELTARNEIRRGVPLTAGSDDKASIWED